MPGFASVGSARSSSAPILWRLGSTVHPRRERDHEPCLFHRGSRRSRTTALQDASRLPGRGREWPGLVMRTRRRDGNPIWARPSDPIASTSCCTCNTKLSVPAKESTDCIAWSARICGSASLKAKVQRAKGPATFLPSATPWVPLPHVNQALKGWPKTRISRPFRAWGKLGAAVPGTLPQADMTRPVGAEQLRHLRNRG